MYKLTLQAAATKLWPERTKAVWSTDAFQSGTSSRASQRLAHEVPVRLGPLAEVLHACSVRCNTTLDKFIGSAAVLDSQCADVLMVIQI